MELYQLLSGVAVRECHADPTSEIPHIVSDSRRAGEGCMFLCLRGVRTDGHRFIRQAKEKGASVVVIVTHLHASWRRLPLICNRHRD